MYKLTYADKNGVTKTMTIQEVYSKEKIADSKESYYKRWSKEEEDKLLETLDTKKSISDIAKEFGRSENSIRMRLGKLCKVPILTE